jgi:D-lactate dehydrogenase (cytochrome)
MDLLAGFGTVLPGDRVVSGEEELKRHGGVFTYHAPVRPNAVVYPESRDEVVEILRFANEHRIPIVPFGQGSSLEAHTIPVNGASASTWEGWTAFWRSGLTTLSRGSSRASPTWS